jgi:hypothetical protein
MVVIFHGSFLTDAEEIASPPALSQSLKCQPSQDAVLTDLSQEYELAPDRRTVIGLFPVSEDRVIFRPPPEGDSESIRTRGGRRCDDDERPACRRLGRLAGQHGDRTHAIHFFPTLPHRDLATGATGLADSHQDRLRTPLAETAIKNHGNDSRFHLNPIHKISERSLSIRADTSRRIPRLQAPLRPWAWNLEIFRVSSSLIPLHIHGAVRKLYRPTHP